ncbi:unnamed protein product, partial [Polarella glacialis]
AEPLNLTTNFCDVGPDADLTSAATVDFSCLFGYCTDGDQLSFSYVRDQVFSKGDFAPLLCQLQTELLAGRSAVASMTHQILANTWWGISGDFQAEIIWVYNAKVAKFEERLPSETQAELARGDQGPFAYYPFYKTLFQNPPQSSNLHANQVNLLAAQAEYTILEHRDLFCKTFTCHEGTA